MKLGKYGTICDPYIADNVEFVKRTCECGHVITFLSRYPRTCTNCGRLVYPNKIDEFREKIREEEKKNIKKS